MPTISLIHGIKVYINWRDHMPPHFHAKYGDDEVLVTIDDIEVYKGTLPPKQLKILLGWASCHQEELMINWKLAANRKPLIQIPPII